MSQGDHRADRQGDGLLGTLLKGAAAGAAAMWVLDRVDWAMWDAEASETRAQTRRARPGGLDPAHVAANRIAGAMGRELNPPQPHPAGLALHYSFGMVPTLAYAVLRHRHPAVAAGGGTLWGLAMTLIEDEGINPALGLAAPPQHYPWQDHARSVVAHAVLGAVAEGVLRALDGPPGRPRRLVAP
ncbi:DUF1440 domain-containing protein [Rubellimicrobium arenae]|uniref:DUF1440 domain-containing protein n=1 Tax=Rubellimicrobium arenae TaxID=2817372 RepID=UPI001B305D0A|nr:DUF1440 domain-containing protein [Rubellimicrobium arenae]